MVLDHTNKCPLHHLCLNAAVTFTLLQMLFDACPSAVNIQDDANEAPLEYLRQLKQITVVTIAQLPAGDFKQACLQHYARLGHVVFCSALVDSGVDPDVGWKHDLRSPRDIGRSALNPQVQEHFRTINRLMGRFQIDPHPRHTSTTCVAISGTNVTTQERVMLKFMNDEVAFTHEIAKREPMNAGYEASTGKCHVVSIISHHELQASDLAQIPQVRLTHGKQQLKFLLVMKLGVEDLSDEISHGAMAGMDKTRALAIAVSIAESFRFLNETCKVMHGKFVVSGAW